MIALRSLIILALTVSVYGVARVSKTEELKRLARLPKIQLAPALEFDRHGGFVVFPDSRALTAEAAKIQKELKAERAPESEVELGRIYDRLGNHGLALRFYKRGIDQLKRKAEIDPSEGGVQALLGATLALTGQFDEALPHLQNAVTLAPEKAECWIAFGTYYKERAWRSLVSDTAIYGNINFLDGLNELMVLGPESNELEEAERFLDSGRDCFERAIRFGPEQASVFAERAVFRAFESAVRASLNTLQTGSELTKPLRATLISDPVLADVQRAAELDPEDPGRLAVAAFLPLVAAIYQEHLAETVLWESRAPRIAPAHAQPVSWAVTQLSGLSESDNPEVAAEAAELLGCVKLLVFRDSAGGLKSFRAALAVSADRERAWDLLTLELNRRADLEQLVEHCSERVIASPSVRNYLFLAKAYERLGEYTKAEWIVLTALATSANDFYANLALANLLLKRPDHEGFLGRVQDCLNKAEKHMGPSPTAQNHLDLALTKGIYFALSDQPEKAREVLRRAEESRGPNPEISAALVAIGY